MSRSIEVLFYFAVGLRLSAELLLALRKTRRVECHMTPQQSVLGLS